MEARNHQSTNTKILESTSLAVQALSGGQVGELHQGRTDLVAAREEIAELKKRAAVLEGEKNHLKSDRERLETEKVSADIATVQLKEEHAAATEHAQNALVESQKALATEQLRHAETAKLSDERRWRLEFFGDVEKQLANEKSAHGVLKAKFDAGLDKNTQLQREVAQHKREVALLNQLLNHRQQYQLPNHQQEHTNNNASIRTGIVLIMSDGAAANSNDADADADNDNDDGDNSTQPIVPLAASNKRARSDT